MTGPLAQFGVVMLTVLLGFATALVALLEDLGGYTYLDALLDLFKTMLGDTDLFDTVSEGSQEVAASILLVIYLIVMTIMLLNLLIAVLSNVHSSVSEKHAIESELSKTSLIQHYVWVVQHNMLPAPLNLIQLPFRDYSPLCCTELGCLFVSPWICVQQWMFRAVSTLPVTKVFFHDPSHWAEELCGLVVFCCAIGPVAIIFGSIKALAYPWTRSAIGLPLASWLMACVRAVVTPPYLVILWPCGLVLSLTLFLFKVGVHFTGRRATNALGEHADEENEGSRTITGTSSGQYVAAEVQQCSSRPMRNPSVQRDFGVIASALEHLKVERSCPAEHVDPRVNSLVSDVRSLRDLLERVEGKLDRVCLHGGTQRPGKQPPT